MFETVRAEQPETVRFGSVRAVLVD